MKTRHRERGAAAVELAIVLPLLVTLVFGIVDFGYAFFVQGTVAGAAREGVRHHAIHNDQSAATATATALIPAGVPVVSVAVTPSNCTSGSDATMTIRYQLQTLSGFFNTMFSGVVIEAKGVMRCGG